MAIVNIIYPKNKGEVLSKLLPIMINTEVRYVESDDINTLFEKCYGSDIILALQFSNSNIIEYLSESTLDTMDGISISKLEPRGRLDEVTPLRANIKGITVDNINIMIDMLLPYIIDIISDNTRGNIKRWVGDDVGYWRNTSLAVVRKAILDGYRDGLSFDVLNAISKAYKTNPAIMRGKDYHVSYMFNRDGYVETNPGLKYMKNRSVHIKEDLSLSVGWVLVDGSYYLFDDHGCSKHETVIDGKIYMLNKYGKLSIDSTLLEVDGEDTSILHFKQEA